MPRPNAPRNDPSRREAAPTTGLKIGLALRRPAGLFSWLPTMIKALTFIIALSCTAAGFAAASNPVEEAFQRYWSAYSKKDFAKAATEVLPGDLDDTKAALLPVMLGAQANTTKEIQELVNTFFGRTVGKSRETMSSADVYAGLQRLVTAGNPQFFELLKDAKVTIIFVRTLDADNAEIHYQVTIGSESDTDVETLTRKNGRWWVRANEDPKAVAAQIKAMVEKKPAS